jgi:hypothetical protein
MPVCVCVCVCAHEREGGVRVCVRARACARLRPIFLVNGLTLQLVGAHAGISTGFIFRKELSATETDTEVETKTATPGATSTETREDPAAVMARVHAMMRQQ